MVDLPAWAPADVNLKVPSAARAYDALLGGAHNFAVDREFARKAELVFPGVAASCMANRAFLRRVVYVDNEPVAVAHSRLILEGNDNATVVMADLRAPKSVLEADETRRLIDFDQPVALLMFAILHFISDVDGPADLVAHYRDALPPGSYLGITHATADSRPEEMRALENLYATSSNPAVARPTGWTTAQFGDFTLIDPGAVYAPEWRPDRSTVANPEHYIFFGGLARKS